MPPGWLDMLAQMLCELYQKWGGDCSELSDTPSKRVAQVVDKYTADGPPTFPDPAALAACLQLLTDLSTLLDYPANSLSDEDVTLLRDMIQDLRAELEP